MKVKMCGVQTFLADVSGLLQEENYRKIYEMVPDFRKEKADRLRSAGDKAQSVGAWYLWMKAQEYLGIRLEEAAQSTGAGEVNFNLSHSGNYVLCSVVSGGEMVGCDIETIKDFREPMAKRFFCPEEYAYIMEQDEAGRKEAFYRYWVLKESVMKATRKGMALGLNTFSIRLGDEGAEECAKMVENETLLVRQPEELREHFYLKEYKTDGARIAVCSTCAKFGREVILLPDFLKNS